VVVCIELSVIVVASVAALQATPVVGLTPVLEESWLHAMTQAITRIDAGSPDARSLGQ